MLQDELAIKYKYKKLPPDIAQYARSEYIRTLPDCFDLVGNPNHKLMTVCNTLISSGYKRIVIGDYGVFIEFDKYQIEKIIYAFKAAKNTECMMISIKIM